MLMFSLIFFLYNFHDKVIQFWLCTNSCAMIRYMSQEAACNVLFAFSVVILLEIYNRESKGFNCLSYETQLDPFALKLMT